MTAFVVWIVKRHKGYRNCHGDSLSGIAFMPVIRVEFIAYFTRRVSEHGDIM